jgi:hypothetical protein
MTTLLIVVMAFGALVVHAIRFGQRILRDQAADLETTRLVQRSRARH